MNELSNEIKDSIVNYSETGELQMLRLVSRRISRAATRRLFSLVHITPDESTQKSFRSILNSSSLSQEVTSIKLTTCIDPEEDPWNSVSGDVSMLSEEYREIINSIWQFPNLRNVEVEFSPICRIIRPRDWRDQAAENPEFRLDVLQTLFSTLNSRERPVPKLRCLSLKNLQNLNDKRITSSDDFVATLSRISELKLKIVTEFNSASPENSWLLPDLYSFFKEMPNVWLKHVEQNLTSLTLDCDIPFGFMPKLDLSSIHFPRLQKLRLGNFVFTHDWQLDWILSHRQTLESLVLDDCPIIKAIVTYGVVDEANYPIDEINTNGDEHRWEYPGTWLGHLGRIEAGLPNLKQFKFGREMSSSGRSKPAGGWNNVGIFSERYMGCHMGLGPSPWCDVEETLECIDDEEFQTIVEKGMESVDEEDEAAYQNLMKVVNSRR